MRLSGPWFSRTRSLVLKDSVPSEAISETISETIMRLFARNIARVARNTRNITRFTRVLLGIYEN